MVVKGRLLLVVASALALLMTAAVPALGASKEASPRPLRQAGLLRVKDIAANGNTSRGAVVAVGWQEGSGPGQLYLAFSLDGGKDYRRANGNLRRYRVVGEPSSGLSLAICGGRVWAGSVYQDPAGGGGRVLMTSRTLGGGAAQAFISPDDGRIVRDVSVACAGKNLLAIGWLERKDGKDRARLMLRTTDPLGQTPAVQRTFKIGPAQLRGGLDVAATPSGALVAFVRDGNLLLKRYAIDPGDPAKVTQSPPGTIAWKDVQGPRLAARANDVVVAYSDAGKAKAKISADLGTSFGAAKRLSGPGSISRPSRVYSADIVGDHVVVEVGSNAKGTITPVRVESTTAGESWNLRPFGNRGARVGVLLKVQGETPVLREAWHDNAPAPQGDTLRSRYES